MTRACRLALVYLRRCLVQGIAGRRRQLLRTTARFQAAGDGQRVTVGANTVHGGILQGPSEYDLLSRYDINDALHRDGGGGGKRSNWA